MVIRMQLDPKDQILLRRSLNKNGKGQRFFTSCPSVIFKATQTPFSTNSIVPWKNSGDVTDFVLSHCDSSNTHIANEYVGPHKLPEPIQI